MAVASILDSCSASPTSTAEYILSSYTTHIDLGSKVWTFLLDI